MKTGKRHLIWFKNDSPNEHKVYMLSNFKDVDHIKSAYKLEIDLFDSATVFEVTKYEQIK
jgi:hypothetical protein